MTLRRTDKAIPKPEPSRKEPKRLERKTRIRPVSAKRMTSNDWRRAFVRAELAARPYCEAGELWGLYFAGGGRWSECTIRSAALHEPLTRARKPGAETITDPVNSVAICNRCHDEIHHHNPRYAENVGLLIPSHGRVMAMAFAAVFERALRCYREHQLVVMCTGPGSDDPSEIILTWTSRSVHPDAPECSGRIITDADALSRWNSGRGQVARALGEP